MLMDSSNRYGCGVPPLPMRDKETEKPYLECNGNLSTIPFGDAENLSCEVAVQTKPCHDNVGEFTFSCSWDSPTNAASQCNIIDGWIVGVSKIPNELAELPTDTFHQSDYEPPAKIRLRNEECSLAINKIDHDTAQRGHSCGNKQITVESRSTQVSLPISANACNLENSVHSLSPCSDGFHGYSSIASGINWKLKSLCGVEKSTFDLYLGKLSQIAPSKMSIENALLIFLVKMKLGLSFTNLATFFSSDCQELSDLFTRILDKISEVCETDIKWPSQQLQYELPTYFQGLYKESRMILICREIECEQPADEQLRHALYSTASQIYSYKIIVGMTPVGRVCFKSKPYEGRKSFKRVLKDCGFLSCLSSKGLVLTRHISPDMEFLVKRGVLLVSPQCTSDGSGVEGAMMQHLENCERRLKFFKVLDKIPVALLSKINELINVCCCIINELPPITRLDQREEET